MTRPPQWYADRLMVPPKQAVLGAGVPTQLSSTRGDAKSRRGCEDNSAATPAFVRGTAGGDQKNQGSHFPRRRPTMQSAQTRLDGAGASGASRECWHTSWEWRASVEAKPASRVR